MDIETALKREKGIVIFIKFALRTGETLIKFPVQELAAGLCKSRDFFVLHMLIWVILLLSQIY